MIFCKTTLKIQIVIKSWKRIFLKMKKYAPPSFLWKITHFTSERFFDLKPEIIHKLLYRSQKRKKWNNIVSVRSSDLNGLIKYLQLSDYKVFYGLLMDKIWSVFELQIDGINCNQDLDAVSICRAQPVLFEFGASTRGHK